MTIETNGQSFDLRGGAHVDLAAPGTVTFVMYAPYKPYVSLVGDFNGWNARAHPMQTDGDGTWWTTIAHPGATCYGFYVAVDQQAHAWIADPYGTQIRWLERGPRAYLPAPDAQPFQWQTPNWQTPSLRELVIYELCVRDFAGRWQGRNARYGDFAEMHGYIDYLAETGVNAVEVMPIQEFPGESSWGYNPVFYFALESTYGTPDDFKRFVDGCHARDIAVIVDVAFNHAWGDHPYYQIYPPLYGPRGEWLADYNPFFHQTPQAINMWGGLDWDHFMPETTRHFQDVVRFWLEEYRVDGFRFDWVGGVDYDSREPTRPGFDPYHGISAICWAARQAKPDCLLIAEYWNLEGTHPEKSEAKLVAETEIDADWNGTFHHTLDEVLNQRWQWEKLDIFRALGGYRDEGFSTATQVVNYSCSHDEVRPEHEVRLYSSPNIERPDGMSVRELAAQKGKLGLIALFAAPGVPMIWMGQEFGEDTPRTIDFLPLNWHKLQLPLHAEHYALAQRLIRARRQHPALRSDNVAFAADNFAADNLVRFQRWTDGETMETADDVAVVALNFSGKPRRASLHFPTLGTWYDIVRDKVRSIDKQNRLIALEPWGGAILVPQHGRKQPSKRL